MDDLKPMALGRPTQSNRTMNAGGPLIHLDGDTTRPTTVVRRDPKLLIVILNYRTPELVVAGLRALEDEVRGLSKTRVVAVDGGSNDESPAIIQSAIDRHGWGQWCALMALEHNRGFAAGNNAAIRPALEEDPPPDFVLLLNPDTEIRPGAVRVLVEYLQANPEVGIAGSRLEDPDGTAQVSAFRFPSVSSELLEGLQLGLAQRLLPDKAVPVLPIPERSARVDWLAGASMLIRREVFEAAGLMDEGYFLYFEEVDFCLNAYRAGWPTHYVPESRVIHYVGQATGVSDERVVRKRIPKYWFESRERFFTKNYGGMKRRLADLAFASAFATYRVRQRLQRKADQEPPRRWRDFVQYNFVPEIEPPRRPIGASLGGRPPIEERGRYNENPPDIGLVALLREDLETYGYDLLEQGLWATLLHRLGNARMSIRFLPVRVPLSVAYKLAHKGVEITTGITLPYTVQLGRRVRIWHHSGIILHADAIGDDVTIRHNTTLGVLRTFDNEELPVIGNGVDLGTGVSILGPVRVGDGARVAAHAVVIKDVPDGATAGGIPARVLKRRAAPNDDGGPILHPGRSTGR